MAPGAENITECEGMQEACWTAAFLHTVFNVASSDIDFFLHHRLFWWNLKKATRSGRDSCSYKHKLFSDRCSCSDVQVVWIRDHHRLPLLLRLYCTMLRRCDLRWVRSSCGSSALTKRCNTCEMEYYLTWHIYWKLVCICQWVLWAQTLTVSG